MLLHTAQTACSSNNAHRHCGDCSEGGSRSWCGHSARHGPHGATIRQTPAWLQTPAELQKPLGLQTPVELQKPVERRPERLGLHQPGLCPLQASGSQLSASGTMDTSRVRSMLLSLPALLQLVAAGSQPRPDMMPRGCPSHCQCDLDGRMLLKVDCSDLGLTELPSNLSVFTSYL